MDYKTFFTTATNQQPYPYQAKLALQARWPELLEAPTGCGKTEAIVLGWLWRALHGSKDMRASTPRRLAYCLPMRVLVEQTRKRVDTWLTKLGEVDKVDVHILMGGEHVDGDWDNRPEREAIFIGTQDMLLSRALNRGYALGRARWPLPYALLNNDCLWVFDEVQLMGSGLLTTAQLAAFREKMGTYGTCRGLWVSATLRSDWLGTVDFEARVSELSRHTLTEDEWQTKPLADRLDANKQLQRANSNSDNPKALAKEILAAHTSGTLTLVVVNTVDRAIKLHAEIHKLKPANAGQTLLLHSRYRPPDRRSKMSQLEEMQSMGGIIVSTQVIEAGVDLSARVMFTELAPWPSLVQRFGRCNRKGEFSTAEVFWIDFVSPKKFDEKLREFQRASDQKQWVGSVQNRDQLINLIEQELSGRKDKALDKALGTLRGSDPEEQIKLLEKLVQQSELTDNRTRPYDASEAAAAKAELQRLTTVGPRALRDHLASMSEDARAKLYPAPQGSVVRRKDALDLFSTTADLTGNDIDISPFVRDVDELNSHVLWRDFDTDPNKPTPQASAQRDELCPVPVGKLNAFLKSRKARAWRWDFVDDKWERADKVVPGQIYLLSTALGGYDSQQGWDADALTVTPVESETQTVEDSNERDPLSSGKFWQTLAQHTDEVVAELEQILSAVGNLIPAEEQATLRDAARWHDWGKAHWVFQKALTDPGKRDSTKQPEFSLALHDVWGKSKHNGDRYKRQGYRHELASALAMLQTQKSDLACYVVAAHHGKVRTSIRSMPNEEPPNDNRRFARGVHDGDAMPEVNLGNGVTAPAITLSLAPMELGLSDDGQPSWAERVLGLLDKYGPFRLAYLEALLCAADRRASAKSRGTP